MRLQEVVDLLDARGCKPKRSGSSYVALCPAHDDRNPSLSIKEGSEGKILVKCHAGCSTEDVLAELDMNIKELFTDPPVNVARSHILPTAEQFFASRGITDRVTVRAINAWISEYNHEARCWIPWLSADDTRIYSTGRALNGAKPKYLHQKGEKPPLYPAPGAWGAEIVCLTDGLIDAIACSQAGTPGFATAGTFSQEDLGDRAADILAGKKTVILVPDREQAAETWKTAAIRKLNGKVELREVVLPQGVKDMADIARLARDEGGDPAEAVALLIAQSRLIDSAAYTKGVAAERKLRFRSAREIAESTPNETNWISRPWLAAGALTEFDGKIKMSGKTTFLMAMCRSILDGEPFMGEPTAKSPIVYLTEQMDSSLKESLRRAHLLDREDFVLLNWADTKGLKWDEVVAEAVKEIHRLGGSVLMVDTFMQFSGMKGDTENSAGAALEAIAPLQLAAGEGIAIAMTRHDRKSGGDVGDSARGSSALAGAVDIIVGIRRPEGNVRPTVRVLHSVGRFDDTPDTLIIELTENGTYVSQGDEPAFASKEAEKALMGALPDTLEKALTLDEFCDAAKVKRTVAQDVIKGLVEAGKIQKTGEGKRGNPFKYCHPFSDSEGEKLSAGTKTLITAETNEMEMGSLLEVQV